MIIFLIGFMGCGKSFTGKYLSADLKIPFVDMDDAIEREAGMTISEIFEQFGEPHFRKLESRFLHNLDPNEDLVVATGGGAPCQGDNMEVMNTRGTTIFLDVDKDVIVQRLLRGIDHRPLLAGMNRYDLEFFYDRKMEERRRFYEQANFHLKHQDIDVISNLVRSMRK